MGRKGVKQQHIEDILPHSGPQQSNDDQLTDHLTEQPTKKQKQRNVDDGGGDDGGGGDGGGDDDGGSAADQSARAHRKLSSKANEHNEQPSKAMEEQPRHPDKINTAAAAAGSPHRSSGQQDHRAAQAEAGNVNTEAQGGAAHHQLPDNVAEQGKVIFLYKPKVTAAGADPSVTSLGDIQRMFVILQPEQPLGGQSRLMVIPKKKLPSPSKHERFYAFIEATAGTPAELTSSLTGNTYSTKTQGERSQPAARAAGEGTYIIATGGSRNGTHLAYKLEIPAKPGEAQRVLGILKEGSFVLSAKNPEHKGQPSRGNVPSAGPFPAYTEEQKQQFAGRSWISVTDTTLLDVAGTELLLVGARDDPIGTGELGDGGELLDQLADDIKGNDVAEKELREHLNPEKANTSQQHADDVIPVTPAVTGNLS